MIGGEVGRRKRRGIRQRGWGARRHALKGPFPKEGRRGTKACEGGVKSAKSVEWVGWEAELFYGVVISVSKLRVGRRDRRAKKRGAINQNCRWGVRGD